MTDVCLSINLNKVALLRNSREGNYPNPLDYGKLCLQHGAAGLTVHPRPDQRHIRASDVLPMRDLVAEFSGKEFNMEGNPFAESFGDFPGFIELVMAAKPHQCTLVPDSNDQLTSDHGFDLSRTGAQLKPLIEQLHADNIRVSLFMDPDLKQIERAKHIGADRIELYTGPYALDTSLLPLYAEAAAFADKIGLGVNAGHDLNLENLSAFCTIPSLAEVSIGHAFTADALLYGWQPTLEKYLTCCRRD